MNTKNDTKLRERIRNLWTDKKGDLGLTQKIAANILNMSQPAFSNYLKEGGLPINTDFVLKFCSMMQVSPDVISTHFIDAGDIGVGLRRTNVKVTRTLTGKLMEAFISLSTANISEDVYAIKVDVVFDILKLGQYLIIDPNIKPREGDYVVKITDNRVIFGSLVRSEEGWYVSYHVNGVFSNESIVKGDTVHFVDSIKYPDNGRREALAL